MDQRIRVIEGGRAFIATGASRPLRRREVLHAPGGTAVRESSVIQEASSGFEVVPRLSGEGVLLEIAEQREALGAAGARVERSASTVSARLGEWVELGGTASEARREERGLLSQRERRSAARHAVRVKVELARD